MIYKNSFRTSQETYYISATKLNRSKLFTKNSIFIVRTIRNAHVHSVRRMRSFSTLKQVLHIEPLGSGGLIFFKFEKLFSEQLVQDDEQIYQLTYLLT
jgi:hypothetical protein